ncbi:Uu.00g040080.m01.CDS01 [Anthostomella pinea]|uniref:Uu.00g040080.m01.CDS01 n=1 Tax=Anthostomella pinea TaxID=933095 RepID=A0AAI8VA51_9PEZI|nr:Uu.00g040080.m01.CDS01 [Anthostomella pinea]
MSAALESLKASIERIILDPAYHDLLAVAKGARNGAVYGAKVRFPHALVMVFLFRSGTLRQKLDLVFHATRTHARNLAKFATIYKLTCYVLKRYGATPGKEGNYDTFIAGLLGGYFVFGGRSSRTGKISSVNQQICVYVFARVVLALARLAVKPGQGFAAVSTPRRSAAISHYAWPVFASVSWAMVMHLFSHHPDDLQPSLRSSMNYIYLQSNEWDGLRNFRSDLTDLNAEVTTGNYPHAVYEWNSHKKLTALASPDSDAEEIGEASLSSDEEERLKPLLKHHHDPFLFHSRITPKPPALADNHGCNANFQTCPGGATDCTQACPNCVAVEGMLRCWVPF